MELTAIYHRPESEYAYLYKENQLHIRIRTKKNDLQKVILHYGDPFIFIEYLFELLDKEDKGVYYGDKGCVEYTQENLDADGNGFKLPYIHEIDGCQVPSWVSEAVWYQIFPERFANGNPRLTPDGAREWDAEISPGRDDFFGGDLQGIRLGNHRTLPMSDF